MSIVNKRWIHILNIIRALLLFCRWWARVLWKPRTKIRYTPHSVCAVPTTWQGDSFCTSHAHELQLQELCTSIPPRHCGCNIFQLSKGSRIWGEKVQAGKFVRNKADYNYDMIVLWNIYSEWFEIMCMGLVSMHSNVCYAQLLTTSLYVWWDQEYLSLLWVILFMNKLWNLKWWSWCVLILEYVMPIKIKVSILMFWFRNMYCLRKLECKRIPTTGFDLF